MACLPHFKCTYERACACMCVVCKYSGTELTQSYLTESQWHILGFIFLSEFKGQDCMAKGEKKGMNMNYHNSFKR